MSIVVIEISMSKTLISKSFQKVLKDAENLRIIKDVIIVKLHSSSCFKHNVRCYNILSINSRRRIGFFAESSKTVIIAPKPICNKVQIQLYSQGSKTVPRNPALKNLWNHLLLRLFVPFSNWFFVERFVFFLTSHDPVEEIQFPKALTFLTYALHTLKQSEVE